MLQIDDLVFNAWGRRFFDHASVLIPTNAKVGLVGRNGVGKSTLFKLILGELSPDGGDILCPRPPASPASRRSIQRPRSACSTPFSPPMSSGTRCTTNWKPPNPNASPTSTPGWPKSTPTAPRPEPAKSWRAWASPPPTWPARWLNSPAAGACAWPSPQRCSPNPTCCCWTNPPTTSTWKGRCGWKLRLRKYPNAAIIISHDRELLNNSVDAILHLQGGKLDLYTGGYDDFEKRRAEKARLQSAFAAKQEAERAHLQSFVDRFRAKASKAAQAQSRMKRLAKMEPVSSTIEERVAPFTLPSPTRPLAPPLIGLEAASVGYDGEPVLRNLNLRLDVDDRIGLLGVNGAGKSTFAKMAAGALALQSGHMQRERRIKVGWFHQHQIEALDPADTPLDIIRRERPDDSETSHRSRLASFGIGFDKQSTTVENLSGGERARLLLNLVAMTAPHLLILDEPTNHLDIDSRRALLDALNDYQGAVILITHDRSLMELVADRLWLAADGTVKPFNGDMDDYARFVLDRAKGGSAPGQLRGNKAKRVKKAA